ncbi:MAG: HAD family hydrolase [Candidatus Hodarchaeales archaeon]
MLLDNSNIKNPPMQAIIFDFDGTLADTFPTFFTIFSKELIKSFQTIQNEYVQGIAKSAYKMELESGNERQEPKLLLLKVFYATCRMLGLKRRTSFYRTLSSAYRVRKNYENVAIYPGAPELLEDLHSKGIPLILITHSSKKKVINILKKNSLDTYFTIILDRSDIGPDKTKGINDAIEALGIDPNYALAIGDLPADITEAKTVGLKTVAFITPTSLVDREMLEAHNPDYICHSFFDLSSLINNYSPVENNYGVQLEK